MLIDPVGLWRDDLPVKNWMILSDKERRSALFADPEGEAAKRFFEVPSDPDARIDALSQFIWSQACTGKFVWPIADRGFRRRAHRIAAPTLIVWGKADSIIAPAYAQEFAHRIAGARVELIDKRRPPAASRTARARHQDAPRVPRRLNEPRWPA